jgi:ADP-ribosylation factor GTPase-activating protein 1
MDESKRDFWDSFAEAGNSRQTGGGGGGSFGGAKPSAIGTSAVKNQGAKKDDDWDKW